MELPSPKTGGPSRSAAIVDPQPEVVDKALTASRALLGVIARSLAPVMDAVTLPQFRVLVVLSNFGPLRMGELAQHLGANQSSFSRFADRMVAGGLIASSASTAEPPRGDHLPHRGRRSRVYAEVTRARAGSEISEVLEPALRARSWTTVRGRF